MEILVICAPVIYFANCLVPALYFFSLDIPIILISVVPVQYRNFLVIFACLTWDVLGMFFLSSWSIYFFFMIVSFVLTFQDAVNTALRRVSR